LRSAEAGSFFFQPLDLHLEPADLLVKLGLDRLALVVVAAAAVAEQGFDDTDLELSAVIDQEDGAACHNPMRFEELCAWIGAARHALKGAECNWTQDVA
jgi:hypothetical protein